MSDQNPIVDALFERVRHADERNSALDRRICGLLHDLATARAERDAAIARVSVMDHDRDAALAVYEREARAVIAERTDALQAVKEALVGDHHDRNVPRAALTERLDAAMALCDAALKAVAPTQATAAMTLQRLRASGWTVAVHNDYRLNGKPYTFWLLTHSNGRWIKGEGQTDDEALAEAARAIQIQIAEHVQRVQNGWLQKTSSDESAGPPPAALAPVSYERLREAWSRLNMASMSMKRAHLSESDEWDELNEAIAALVLSSETNP